MLFHWNKHAVYLDSKLIAQLKITLLTLIQLLLNVTTLKTVNKYFDSKVRFTGGQNSNKC
jgi:hypothetical protein